MINSNNVVLNRPVFVQQVFDSSGLTVLTTLLHRFAEPGNYDLLVQRGGKAIWRTRIAVFEQGGPLQINVDLATLGVAESLCICKDDEGYKLGVGGVMGFYVSEGVGRYTVQITQMGPREKRVWLDNSKMIPAGDLFAVTLVRPGDYVMINADRAKGKIVVQLPRGEKYRMDQATLVQVTEQAFEPKGVKMLSGQSVVFLCQAAARLRIELARAEPESEPSEPRPPEGRRRRGARIQPSGPHRDTEMEESQPPPTPTRRPRSRKAEKKSEG